MGNEEKIPGTHKEPIILENLGGMHELESTLSAVLLEDAKYLSWEAMKLDQI